jgi:hypothetical protein
VPLSCEMRSGITEDWHSSLLDCMYHLHVRSNPEVALVRDKSFEDRALRVFACNARIHVIGMSNKPGFATSAGRSSTLTSTMGSSERIESTPCATFPELQNISQNRFEKLTNFVAYPVSPITKGPRLFGVPYCAIFCPTERKDARIVGKSGNV